MTKKLFFLILPLFIISPALFATDDIDIENLYNEIEEEADANSDTPTKPSELNDVSFTILKKLELFLALPGREKVKLLARHVCDNKYVYGVIGVGSVAGGIYLYKYKCRRPGTE